MARRLDLGFTTDIYLIPLFGHTRGHCGVAIPQDDRWLLHAGDTYYRRLEATQEPNPYEAIVAHTCDDNDQRIASLTYLKTLLQDHADTVTFFSTHDLLEFAPEVS